jgi:hypothetical protein
LCVMSALRVIRFILRGLWLRWEYEVVRLIRLLWWG